MLQHITSYTSNAVTSPHVNAGDLFTLKYRCSRRHFDCVQIRVITGKQDVCEDDEEWEEMLICDN